jgi:hypothetical protein
MTIEQAVEIREQAKAHGLQSSPEHKGDIAILDRLSRDGIVGAFTINPGGPKNPSVVGRAVEDAARRLRRHMRAAQ